MSVSLHSPLHIISPGFNFFLIVFLALKELRALSIKPFAAPGESGWPLGGMYPTATSASEINTFKTYMKQAREEIAIRLVERLFDGPAQKNKWWQVRF